VPVEFSYAFNHSCRCYVATVREDDLAAECPKVLAAGFYATETAAFDWLARMKIERPWKNGRSTVAGLSFFSRRPLGPL
jgi:hypothetical protein